MSDREFFESGDAEQRRRDAEDTGRAGMGYDPDPGQVDDEPLALVDQILMTVPERDPSRPLLYQLRRLLLEREITFQEARRALVELEGALEKVTAPANRVGIFLGSPKDGIANVWVGGSEYYANIDSRLDPSDLDVGARILINEAYAVVGTLGYPPGGPVVRIADLLDEGRLRIGQEHGSSDTVLERSASLEDVDLKVGDEVRYAVENVRKAGGNRRDRPKQRWSDMVHRVVRVVKRKLGFASYVLSGLPSRRFEREDLQGPIV